MASIDISEGRRPVLRELAYAFPGLWTRAPTSQTGPPATVVSIGDELKMNIFGKYSFWGISCRPEAIA